MWCVNQLALHIAFNPLYHEQTKHIEIDYHFIREKLQENIIFYRIDAVGLIGCIPQPLKVYFRKNYRKKNVLEKGQTEENLQEVERLEEFMEKGPIGT